MKTLQNHPDCGRNLYIDFGYHRVYKGIGFLDKIPTKFQVLILSLAICVIGFFAYLSYASIAFVWYYLVAVIFAAFIVAIVCCKGWDYLFEIWARFYRKKD